MKYVIYRMEHPEHLEQVVNIGYGSTRTYRRSVLEELNVDWVNIRHDSFEQAVSEIEKNVDKLKDHELTILPIINIDYLGSIIKPKYKN